ncbi:MAG: pentapeptide repeat-containing protein [Limnohabitans sp.]|nr:pentapeptide repeat-containing protein [Limnohabitans sp.]
MTEKRPRRTSNGVQQMHNSPSILGSSHDSPARESSLVQFTIRYLVIISYLRVIDSKGATVAVNYKPSKVLPLVLAAVCAALPWAAGAFDAGKMEDFKTTNVCKYCDLTDAPLGGRDMRGADFQNANLSGAVLVKANLGERPMEKRTLVTNFEDANLRRTDLSGANLHLANFTNSYLREANLSGADLSEAVLLNANMKGAVLAGANLKGAKMDDAKLDDAKFCKTVMPDGALNDSGC